MTDIRQRLTALLLERIDRRDDDLADAVDALLAEFLVAPRSEVDVEYGVESAGTVHGNTRSPDAARLRAQHVFDTTTDAARRREVWIGPWEPVPETSTRCRVCLTVPLPDEPGYVDQGVALQCQREDGHKGMHRYHDPITWTTPKEQK
jgi:hypothetical protein